MLPIDLPPPDGCKVSPKWDGRNFVYGDQSSPVLEYSENFAGWSDDLTALHEESAGDSHPIDIASRRDAIAQIKKCMPPHDAVIMEIGCSSGFLIRDLVRYFPKAAIIGADVVKEPLYRLANYFPGIPLIRFDLLQCPIPDQSVDILVMLNVLEHIDDDVAALEKAHNLLKPGGSMIIEVPAGRILYDAYDAELCHFRRYSASDLQRKLIVAGFEIKRKSHLGFVIFPAFAAVKLMNILFKFRKNKEVVREQAASTSGNRLVRLVMKFESKYLSTFSLPFGIRVLMTAQRPS
jgi:SAM-dependent methyltransferase